MNIGRPAAMRKINKTTYESAIDPRNRTEYFLDFHREYDMAELLGHLDVKDGRLCMLVFNFEDEIWQYRELVGGSFKYKYAYYWQPVWRGIRAKSVVRISKHLGNGVFEIEIYGPHPCIRRILMNGDTSAIVGQLSANESLIRLVFCLLFALSFICSVTCSNGNNEL